MKLLKRKIKMLSHGIKVIPFAQAKAINLKT